jgi:ubiquinone/menaquinone biosynthesis C-methylase UbiE
MGEFCEQAFQEKRMMWGEEPIALARDVAELFQQLGLRKVLIPGFGYGRNAKPFDENGCDVTGIEISSTAIELAYELWGREIRVFHGSVHDMPFDQDVYDGIFCHALIHLLDSDQRKKLILDCYRQIRRGGLMVFTAITKDASTYGVGEKLETDRYRTKDGVDLYFYDEHAIKKEFAEVGLIEAAIIDEARNGKPGTRFWKIICKKTEDKKGAGIKP